MKYVIAASFILTSMNAFSECMSYYDIHTKTHEMVCYEDPTYHRDEDYYDRDVKRCRRVQDERGEKEIIICENALN